MNETPGHPSPAPIALCLGGLDPSGGAGLLRDVQVLASLGIYAMALCTAETIQNGSACLEIAPPRLSPTLGLQALRPHLSGPWGLKLGLCALDSAVLKELILSIKDAHPQFRIWDPIMAPTSGVGLHCPEELQRMAREILPAGGWTVSPNRCEAQALLGSLTSDANALARPWLDLGAEAVWLKGGHSEGDEVEDVWITKDGVTPLGSHPRLPGERRGTGCSLASAWLGLRLQGVNAMTAAVQAADWLRTHWLQAGAPGGYGRPAFLPVHP
ncbi:MAG: bifunctional hydroxymethylpyrimidine kinase/phosphomethylpyrimidine kinase [Holophagaceae bacterium]|nr:bifunctional hydroxymethylpyrimidine kinase/phosphomethylpyrimidine kinase [Holophagaceae bacterium]